MKRILLATMVVMASFVWAVPVWAIDPSLPKAFQDHAHGCVKGPCSLPTVVPQDPTKVWRHAPCYRGDRTEVPCPPYNTPMVPFDK